MTTPKIERLIEAVKPEVMSVEKTDDGVWHKEEMTLTLKFERAWLTAIF
jgi:hypothetical protein